MKIISYFFCTLFIYSSVGISQWINNFTIPDANWVGRLEVVDENVLWGLMSFNNGVPGFICTTDGGENWHYDSLKSSFITAIYPISASTSYIALFDSLDIARIIKTSDGGITWNIQPTAFGQSESWIDYVYFFDDLNGFAFGDPIGGYCEIYTTTNGGDYWIQVPNTNIPPSLNNEYPIWFSYSVYENSIWIPVAVQSQKKCRIFKSTDRGYTWTATNQFSISATLNILPTSIVFKNHSEGILVFSDYYAGQSEYVIYKTTNGGIDWSILNFPLSIEPAFISNIRGTSSGYFVSAPLNNSGTAYTTDGGNNWTQVDNKSIWDVDMISPSSGWAAASPTTNQAIIYKWNEFPQSGWYQQNSGTTENIYSVALANTNTGWVVGYYEQIRKTTDGGESWTSQHSGTGIPFYSVCFVNVNTGWAVGEGYMHKTTNGGTDWIVQDYGSYTDLTSVYFINENYGCVVGLSGFIRYTTDGGTFWNSGFGQPGWLLNSIFLTESNSGWAVGQNGTIVKTTDLGISWTTQNSGTTESLRGVHFEDINTGWAVGNNGSILKTVNGGTNWVVQPSGTNNNLTGVFFVSINDGWVVGNNGTILRTTNGGEDWWIQNSGTTEYLRSVCFENADLGWVVGDGGTILHTTNGGVSFVEEEQIDEIPTEFLLSNNYPNPFNPSTKIKYQIPASLNPSKGGTLVILKVYDILGNDIETLVNEEKPAGTYELTWYAENLPSGVYFYQLIAGEFISTKKMLLLK